MANDQSSIGEREMKAGDAATGSKRKQAIRNWGIAFLVLLIGVGIWRLVIYPLQEKAPNVELAEEITRAYVEALHNEEVTVAYGLLSEEIRSHQSREAFAASLKEGANFWIEKYQALEVCEFQFGSPGNVTAIGLLHYAGGDVYFVSNLVEDADDVLGVYRFYTDTEVELTP
jgi:hypothetical protein